MGPLSVGKGGCSVTLGRSLALPPIAAHPPGLALASAPALQGEVRFAFSAGGRRLAAVQWQRTS